MTGNQIDELLSEMVEEVWVNRESKFDKDSGRGEDCICFPLGMVKFPELTKEQIIEVLGRKWKCVLSKFKTFVDEYKYKTSSKVDTVLELSVENARLVDAFGSHQNVSRMISDAVEIGLLKCVSESFQFGADNSRCKKYAYNKKTQYVLDELFKENDIYPYLLNGAGIKRHFTNWKSLESKCGKSPYIIKITQKTNMVGVTDEMIEYALIKRYPQLRHYMGIVEKINSVIPQDEMISFKPTITRCGKAVVKIGMRASNPMVTLPKEDDGKMIRTRDEILTEKLGEWTEIDVKSSVPRVTYLMNNGVWLDEKKDLYSMMFGSDFVSEQQREEYKAFFMRLYFVRSERQICHLLKVNKQIEGFYGKYGKDMTEKMVAEAVSRMNAAIGKSYMSEIFLHESCIYLDVMDKLISSGHRVVQIYDAFFIKGKLGSEEILDVRKLIRKCAEGYWTKWVENSLKQ